jgi:hypothetical protein
MKTLILIAMILAVACVKNPTGNSTTIKNEDLVKIELHLKQGKCEFWNPEIKDSIVTVCVDSYAMEMVVKNYSQDSVIRPGTYIFFGDTIQIVTEKIPGTDDRQQIYKIYGTDSILCIFRAVPKVLCYPTKFGDPHFPFKPEIILIAPVDTTVYLKCNSKHLVMKEINGKLSTDTLFIGTIAESIRLD